MNGWNLGSLVGAKTKDPRKSTNEVLFSDRSRGVSFVDAGEEIFTFCDKEYVWNYDNTKLVCITSKNNPAYEKF